MISYLCVSGGQGAFPSLSEGVAERTDLATEAVFFFLLLLGALCFFHVVLDFF